MFTFFREISMSRHARPEQACRQLRNATYVMEKHSAAELRLLGIKPQPVAMIDYVLISQRFQSSTEGGRVRSVPTMLRHGLGKYDHVIN
jgi:hypothetical protein